MIAKYSPWVAARAYTWPVEEEQCTFEDPVGFNPPLQENVSISRIYCNIISLYRRGVRTWYSLRRQRQEKGHSRWLL